MGVFFSSDDDGPPPDVENPHNREMRRATEASKSSCANDKTQELFTMSKHASERKTTRLKLAGRGEKSKAS